jgi:hypothetical protein
MINTYINNETTYIIKHSYQSLKVDAIDNIGVKNKKVIIKQDPIVNGYSIVFSPKIGINFSLYNMVKVTE